MPSSRLLMLFYAVATVVDSVICHAMVFRRCFAVCRGAVTRLPQELPLPRSSVRALHAEEVIMLRVIERARYRGSR